MSPPEMAPTHPETQSDAPASTAVKEDRFALGADQEAGIATASQPSNAKPTSTTAATISNVDVSMPLPEPKVIPRYSIQSVTDAYEVFGVDAIWHNQYLGPESDWYGFRKTYDCDIDAMVLLVARHVQQGLYFIISMNATKHGLVVVCGCMKMVKDMPEDMFHDPAFKEEETLVEEE